MNPSTALTGCQWACSGISSYLCFLYWWGFKCLHVSSLVVNMIALCSRRLTVQTATLLRSNNSLLLSLPFTTEQGSIKVRSGEQEMIEFQKRESNFTVSTLTLMLRTKWGDENEGLEGRRQQSQVNGGGWDPKKRVEEYGSYF